MRTRVFLRLVKLVSVSLLVHGCGDPTSHVDSGSPFDGSSSTDAGADNGGGEDAGFDAGMLEFDGGTQVDAGMDAPLADASPDTPLVDAGPDTPLVDAGPDTPECGNGVQEGVEACDDGNAIENDGCRNDCTVGCRTGTDECSNDLFCDGEETCAATGVCESGAPPTLSDGFSCTVDACSESLDRILHTPNNSVCAPIVSRRCDRVGASREFAIIVQTNRTCQVMDPIADPTTGCRALETTVEECDDGNISTVDNCLMEPSGPVCTHI